MIKNVITGSQKKNVITEYEPSVLYFLLLEYFLEFHQQSETVSWVV